MERSLLQDKTGVWGMSQLGSGVAGVLLLMLALGVLWQRLWSLLLLLPVLLPRSRLWHLVQWPLLWDLSLFRQAWGQGTEARGPLNPWIWPWMWMLRWLHLLRVLRLPLGRSRLWLLGLLGR